MMTNEKASEQTKTILHTKSEKEVLVKGVFLKSAHVGSEIFPKGKIDSLPKTRADSFIKANIFKPL